MRRAILPLCVCLFWFASDRSSRGDRAPESAIEASDRVVKLYGAGGLRGIEAYQSGILVSGDGEVLTTNSLVLDQGQVTVVLHNGNRFLGEVLGADPTARIAVIRFDPAGEPVPHFELGESSHAVRGQSVIALANVFGIASGNEPVSAMHGVVAAVAPLRAQRGPLERIDGDQVYLLDAVTSNPGAAGGALVDEHGVLLGMLGQELKSRVTGAWMSYAIPTEQLSRAKDRIVQGHDSVSSAPEEEPREEINLLAVLGFELVPEVVPRTPPYIDYVQEGGAAEDAGLQPDDLIVMADGFVAATVGEFRRIMGRAASSRPIPLVVQRGDDLLEFKLTRPPNRK